MDVTKMMQVLPESTHTHLFLLLEAGAQPKADFLVFIEHHANQLHSLYIHPQLTEFQDYGPWLLEIDNAGQLTDYLASLQGCTAVIVSTRYPSMLAVRLSRGCTIVRPDGTTVLTRFYASHVMEVLARSADCDWHAFLFDGIRQWWFPGERQWQRLSITPSEVEYPTNHIIRLNCTLWQQIADPPEITSVLNEWQKMTTSKMFPPCAQRLMVMNALDKAERVGLEKTKERVLYALFYLNGDKKILESDALRTVLPDVVAGMKSLAEVLSHHSHV